MNSICPPSDRRGGGALSGALALLALVGCSAPDPSVDATAAPIAPVAFGAVLRLTPALGGVLRLLAHATSIPASVGTPHRRSRANTRQLISIHAYLPSINGEGGGCLPSINGEGGGCLPSINTTGGERGGSVGGCCEDRAMPTKTIAKIADKTAIAPRRCLWLDILRIMRMPSSGITKTR